MEKRKSARLDGVSEIDLKTLDGTPLSRASILDLSEGGLLVAYLAANTNLALGDRVKFRFVVPTGEVIGTAEVVRATNDKTEVGLRILGIENEAGVSNLLGFLHSLFCGAPE